MSDIIIEPLTQFSSETAESIKKLASKIGPNYKPLADEDIKEMIDSPALTLLIAKEQTSQNIAGMITLIVYRIPYVRKAYLDDLIVDEAYRGKGIGSQLMKAAVTKAQEKGASYIDFTSRPRRAESNGLYEKLGFKKRETNVYRLIIDYAEL